MAKQLVKGALNLIGNAPLKNLSDYKIGMINSQFNALEAMRPRTQIAGMLSAEKGHSLLRDLSKRQLQSVDTIVKAGDEKVYDGFYSGLKFRYESQSEYNARVLADLAKKKQASTNKLQGSLAESYAKKQELIRLQLSKEFPDLDVKGIPSSALDSALAGKPLIALPDSVADRVTREANERVRKLYPHNQVVDVASERVDGLPVGTTRAHPTTLMRMSPLYDARTKASGLDISFDPDLMKASLRVGANADEFFSLQKDPFSYFDSATGKIVSLNDQKQSVGMAVKQALPMQKAVVDNTYDKERILSVVLDLLEAQHQKPVGEAISSITDAVIESTVKKAVKTGVQPGVIASIQSIVRNYLESQRIIGARTIQLPDAKFVEAFKSLISDEMPQFLKSVNDSAFQAGFISEKMNQISRMYYKPQFNPETGGVKPPVVSKIAESLTEINSINRNMATYYYEQGSGNAGEFMNFHMYFGMVRFENHSQYAHIFERMKNGLPVFENPLYQARRKMNELRAKRAPGDNLATVYANMDQTKFASVAQIPTHLTVAKDFANKQFEALQDSFGLNEMSLPAQLTARHVHNIDLIDKLERLSITAQSYGTASSLLTRSEGLNYFQSRLANSLVRMGPEDFSKYFYHETYGILSVDKTILEDNFDSGFLADLRDIHGINVVYEDNGRLVFKGDMTKAPNYQKLAPIRLPEDSAIPNELRSLVLDVEDSIYQASEVRPAFSLLDGGGLRVNGANMADELFKIGVFTAEEAEEFANTIQHTGLLKTSFVGGHEALTQLIGEGKTPGSALSVWSNSLLTLSNHSSTKYVFMRHLFDPSSSVGYVFGEDAVTAFEAFNKASKKDPFTYKFVFLDAKGNIQEFIPKTIKDMQLAIDNKLTVTTYSGVVNFSKKLNTFELNPLVNWIDQNVTTFYKAGYFMSLGLAMRNGLDTPLKALMTEGMEFDQLVGSIRDAHKHIQLFSRVIKESGGLLDKAAVDKVVAGLSLEEKRMFTIMQMLYHYKITGTPLSSILDVTEEKRLYEMANGLREVVATDLQSAVWGFPPLKFILSVFGDIEEHVRIATALFRLNQGMSMDHIVTASARQFVDYSFKSPGLKTANALIPFVQFALSNAAFWADEATTNPLVFKFIIELTAESTISQANREKRELSRLEGRVASVGNFKMGADTFKWNPSMFDAIALVPGVLTSPTQRMNPVVKSFEKVMRGDVEGIELPFESPVTRSYKMISDTLPKVMAGENIRLGEALPSIFTSNTIYPASKGLSRSYTSSVSIYNRYVGRGSKMGQRYGGLYRSSVQIKKRFGSLYNQHYTKGGISRMKMAMSPTTAKNLKYKMMAIKYRFR